MNAITLYRIERYFYEKKIPILPQLIKIIIFLLFNSIVPYTAKIGKGTKFGYGGIGVVIHARSEIGQNVIIGTNVTIGGRSKRKNVPVIGDNVYIGTGAKILGDIKVGNNVVIGANSVVIADVGDNTVVGGIPARVIKSEIQIEDYV